MVLSTAVRETQFSDQFRDFLRSEADEGVRSMREQAFQAFTSMGFPTSKHEDWKYTAVAPLAKVDWRILAPERNTPLEDTNALGAFNYLRNGFTALNLAFANIQVIRISRDTAVDEPIKLHF